MNLEPQSFTDRSNARRAAKRLLAAGQAPEFVTDFTVKTGEDGRFYIVWQTGPAAEEGNVTTEQVEDELAAAADRDAAAAQRWAAEAEAVAQTKTGKTRRQRAKSAGPRAKYGTAAAPGIMPDKPALTAEAGRSYQKRIDHLAELAAGGDWPAIAAYEVKGHNTYSKIVARYRDALLAAQPLEPAAQGAERYPASRGL